MERHDPLRPPGLRLALAALALFSLLGRATALAAEHPPGSSGPERGTSMTGTVRVGYLHHSTGAVVWAGGVDRFIREWNAARGTDYRIAEQTYPSTSAGYSRYLGQRLGMRVGRFLGGHYPWANYPYDYWNLWVANTGQRRDRGEDNLDDLVKKYDVIVFKHCFPVSRVLPDGAAASVSSDAKTIANFKLQYQALKERLHQFPSRRFIVWTGPPLLEVDSNPADAQRATEFFAWVKDAWDEKGDNIFLWDYRAIATDGGLFFKPEYAYSREDSHPNAALASKAAPAIGQRIVDVIEGRGDTASITGL